MDCERDILYVSTLRKEADLFVSYLPGINVRAPFVDVGIVVVERVEGDASTICDTGAVVAGSNNVDGLAILARHS